MEKIKLYLAQGTGAAILPETALRALNDLFARQALNSGAIAIQAASNPGAKTVNTVTAVIDGKLVQKAAANLPALTGYNLTANQYGLVIYTVDLAGNFAAYYGTPAASLAGVGIPPVPPVNQSSGASQCVVGALVLQNGGSAFTGGTTALDTITTTYINIVGPFVPTALF